MIYIKKLICIGLYLCIYKQDIILNMKSNRILIVIALIIVIGFSSAFISSSTANSYQSITKESPVIIGVRALDLNGKTHKIGITDREVHHTTLVFIGIGCPISQRYIPTLNTLYKEAKQKNVAFYGVISDQKASWKEAKEFADQFDIKFPILFDSNGDLAQRLQPTAVPESFVIDKNDTMIYHGRINDQYATIGKFNSKVRSADLQLAIHSVANKLPMPYAYKKAVGCIFESWKKKIQTVNYNKHIAPIIKANCTSCHRDGEIAPFALQNYNDAFRRGQMIQFVTESRYMPIWKAKPGFGKFSNEHYLSDYQISLIQDWVAQGMPEGDPKDLLPNYIENTPEWKLGTPDLIVEMDPYDLPAEGDDQYRVFVLKGVIPKGKILKGYIFKPGDKSVVHHSTVFVDYTGTLKKYDNEDPLPGYNAFEKGSTMEFGSAITIGNWAPGVDSYTYPKGIGFHIESDADVAIENHYHLSGKATTDVSKVGLYFADASSIDKYAAGSIVGSQKLFIKANDSLHTKKLWTYVPNDILLTDLGPHMHYIGKEAKLEIIEPNGHRKPLIHITDWDLRWQSIYSLREPLLIKKGSVIEGTYVYDNSDNNHDNPHYPAKDMFWGWGSNDEMLEFYLTYVPVNPNDYGKMLGASFASFEHFYDASERISVTKENSKSIYQTYKNIDIWSRKGQILMISIVESNMANDILAYFKNDAAKKSESATFFINQAELTINKAYFKLDEKLILKAGNEASSLLKKAFRLDPDNWNATFSTAKMLIGSEYTPYVKQGIKILEKNLEYQESLPKQDKYSKVYLELGKYYYTIKDDTKATMYLKRGLKLYPTDPDIAQSLYSDGKIQKKELN